MPQHDPKLVEQWLSKANEDFRTVEIIRQSDDPLWGIIGFHCQQAVEKWIKGWLTLNGVDFPKTHDISELLDIVMTVDPLLAGMLESSEILSYYGVVPRYPGDIPDLNRQAAEEAFRVASEIRGIMLKEFQAIK